jgi:hypothetical protein
MKFQTSLVQSPRQPIGDRITGGSIKVKLPETARFMRFASAVVARSWPFAHFCAFLREKFPRESAQGFLSLFAVPRWMRGLRDR